MNTEIFCNFVREVFNEKENFIPLHEPRFIGNEQKYVNQAIESTFVSSVGAYVDKFEGMVAQITGTKKAVAIVNGTSALQAALRLTGVSAGDEVITQALTFIATANAIKYNFAEPLFLDVDLDTMGLSHKAVSDFLDEYGDLREDGCYNKKTQKKIAACMPMHTFGFPVHIDELLAVCEKWNIPVVEDAAESLGSLYKGKHTGSFGKLGVYSFNGNKIVTAGGGGAIVTNDEKLGAFAKYITNTAKKPHPYEFYHDELGYNFRMPNLNAALICAQIEQLDLFLEKKRALAKRYSDYFEEIGIRFRTENKDTRVNYWLMCVELDDKQSRNSFLDETNSKGVMTRPIWQLMYKLPMYLNCFKDDQKNAEYLEDRIVNVPSSVIIND
jgi:perosamine synthetase